MIKRNFTSILIITVMFLNIINYDYTTSLGSKKFLLFVVSIAILLVSILRVYVRESKRKKEMD